MNFCRRLVASGGTVDLEEHVLRDLFRPLAVPDEVIGEVHDGSAVLLEELAEGLGVALPYAQHELHVRVGRGSASVVS